MALRDILVHTDSTALCEKRMKLALKIAKDHDACITALFAQATSRSRRPSKDDQKKHNKLSEKCLKQCLSLTEKAGIKLNWETAPLPRAKDRVTDQLVHFAQHMDMVVVGQYDEKSDAGTVPHDMSERLVLESGRPVLIIPYAGDFKAIGKRVVAAWSTGRESVRAINDAIPLMQNAKKVKVIAVNPGKPGKRHGKIPSADITQHLVRHGIKAEADHFSGKGVDEGNILLNYLADNSADLLVMGAYGHHRFRELILGGVTQVVIEHMTVPVLMSH